MAPSEEEKARAVAAAGEEEEERAGKVDRQRDEKMARKLLKPRKRAQVEVWVGETTSQLETQRCTAGRSFGHHSDLTASSARGQPCEVQRVAPADSVDICRVCGRSFEDVKPVVTQPERTDKQPKSGKPGKEKHMFRGIRAAMGQIRASKAGGKGGDKDEEERWDRAISTQMFLADASEYASSDETGVSSSGPFGFGACENKELEERMARLIRAQKLLDRSQANGDKARRTDIVL